MESDKRYNRRTAASKITKIEVEGESYEVDTINVSKSGLLVETDAPLEVGTKVIWGDETTGRIEGVVARVTLDGYGIILRPGQSAMPHVLRRLTDGLLAPEGDPEVRKPPKQKRKPKKSEARTPQKQKRKPKKNKARKPTKQKGKLKKRKPTNSK